jgi:hypothetical protein
MQKRLDACEEIFQRIKTNRVDIGLKQFKRTPTVQAKVEEFPICFMNYGKDLIVKRSSRTSSPTRKGEANMRSLEVVLEIVARESSDIMSIFEKVRAYVLADIHPLKDENGIPDPSTHMYEERTEGPIGYGLPEIVAMIFVITLIYPDEI